MVRIILLAIVFVTSAVAAEYRVTSEGQEYKLDLPHPYDYLVQIKDWDSLGCGDNDVLITISKRRKIMIIRCEP